MIEEEEVDVWYGVVLWAIRRYCAQSQGGGRIYEVPLYLRFFNIQVLCGYEVIWHLQMIDELEPRLISLQHFLHGPAPG